MALIRHKVIISLKNTIPTYLLISVFTLVFLFPGRTIMSFSRFGESLPAKIFFSLAFNLLYFIPQFTGILLGLHSLKKKGSEKVTPEKAKWFLRIPAPTATLMTAILIVLYFTLGFFPEDVNLRELYITFLIIILMNIMFCMVMTINIYSSLTGRMKRRGSY